MIGTKPPEPKQGGSPENSKCCERCNKTGRAGNSEVINHLWGFVGSERRSGSEALKLSCIKRGGGEALEEEDGEDVVTHAAPRGTARAAEPGSSLLGGDKGQEALGERLLQPDAPESVTTSHARAASPSSAPCVHVLGAWGQNAPRAVLLFLSSLGIA